MLNMTKTKKVFCVRERCAELLYVKIELPQIEFAENESVGLAEKKHRGAAKRKSAGAEQRAGELFNRYYSRLAACAEEWASGFAEGEIRAEYEGVSEHERKFNFRRYIYTVGYRYEMIGDLRIKITCEFRLVRAGIVLMDKVKSDIWMTESFLMSGEHDTPAFRAKIKNAQCGNK